MISSCYDPTLVHMLFPAQCVRCYHRYLDVDCFDWHYCTKVAIDQLLYTVIKYAVFILNTGLACTFEDFSKKVELMPILDISEINLVL